MKLPKRLVNDPPQLRQKSRDVTRQQRPDGPNEAHALGRRVIEVEVLHRVLRLEDLQRCRVQGQGGFGGGFDLLDVLRVGDVDVARVGGKDFKGFGIGLS